MTSTNATADLLACLYPSNPRVLSLLPHMRQIMRLTGALDLVSVIRGGASKFRETGSRTFRNRVRRCTPLWLTLAQHVNAGLVNFGRAYGSSGGASEQSKTRSARSYLERWAGIRDGVAHRSEAATSGKSYGVPKFPRRTTTSSDLQQKAVSTCLGSRIHRVCDVAGGPSQLQYFKRTLCLKNLRALACEDERTAIEQYAHSVQAHPGRFPITLATTTVSLNFSPSTMLAPGLRPP